MNRKPENDLESRCNVEVFFGLENEFFLRSELVYDFIRCKSLSCDHHYYYVPNPNSAELLLLASSDVRYIIEVKIEYSSI